MSIDRERIDEHLDLGELRERLDEQLRPRALRERVEELYAYAFLPPSVTNEDVEVDGRAERIDVEFGEFDVGGWLGEGGAPGPTTPPSEPRVVSEPSPGGTGVDEATYDGEGFRFVEWMDARPQGSGGTDDERDEATEETTDDAAASGEFQFGAWLGEGEGEAFERVTVEESDEAADEAEPFAEEPDEPILPRPSVAVHPAKAATYLLFLAVAVLAVLSMSGALSALGPATGI